MQHGSDLIGLVEQAAVIACPAGGHLIGADLLAVEINIIQPQRRGAGIRGPQPRLYGERRAHHCTGGGFPAGFGGFRAHKLGFPLGCWVQQGGDEHRRFAPQGLLGASSGIGPNLHTGVIFLQRLQRQARRVHRGGVSGFTGFIVQQRGKIRGQGNLQAVLRLADVPAVPFQLPAEHGGMSSPTGVRSWSNQRPVTVSMVHSPFCAIYWANNASLAYRSSRIRRLSIPLYTRMGRLRPMAA